jgi:NAD(P)-dependent dehydrogenase (short-subunit alcohol dehydrogenase family)
MSELQGTVLVTGANGGLGSAIVSRIVNSSLGKEYYGAYTVRSPKTAKALDAVLKKAKDHEHGIIPMDLSSLAKVREAAALINQRVADGAMPPIRALILNAAFQENTTLTMTEDGFDTTFQVNHLSHFLFTLLILQSMDKEKGRVVVIGSWSHE